MTTAMMFSSGSGSDKTRTLRRPRQSLLQDAAYLLPRHASVMCVKFSKFDHGVRLSHPLGAAVARLPKAQRWRATPKQMILSVGQSVHAREDTGSTNAGPSIRTVWHRAQRAARIGRRYVIPKFLGRATGSSEW